jgi:hypothetical protein
MSVWTEELFTISRVNFTSPVTYVLKDDSGEKLKCSFYKPELQKFETNKTIESNVL